ncbi:Peptidase inhibitor [Echinococcus granulosus]|uniref:Peptidase inhibitor n=1 Tax=Echinococcus granulosus TaxID=6210 RepID=W6U2P1_ECHGR|nr:Peptidase inhibitor [Echinococcus granulosus]EUB54826.1 Peptidase inhibitor [Echinococcus granulosus]
MWSARAISLILAIMIKAASLLTALFAVVHALSEEDRRSILELHTAAREQVRPPASNMMLMKYSPRLENLAERWARRCRYAHTDPQQHPEYRGVGQNLAASGGLVPTVRWLANMWKAEVKYYTYSNNSCIPFKVCGHYTQMVWADSTELGCAINRCDSMLPAWRPPVYYLVCQYSPAGNFIGRKPYTEGGSCTKCPTGYDCTHNQCWSR